MMSWASIPSELNFYLKDMILILKIINLKKNLKYLKILKLILV